MRGNDTEGREGESIEERRGLKLPILHKLPLNAAQPCSGHPRLLSTEATPCGRDRRQTFHPTGASGGGRGQAGPRLPPAPSLPDRHRGGIKAKAAQQFFPVRPRSASPPSKSLGFVKRATITTPPCSSLRPNVCACVNESENE